MKNTFIFDQIEYVLVQGDTSTACAIALSAFNNKKKIIHLEAGLRSNDIQNPYPEEMNRQIISRMATIHLCPTQKNKNNLIIENINDNIYVVGNTGLDNIDSSGCIYDDIVLITMHRRDYIPLIKDWFNQFNILADKYKNIKFYFPIHPNPDIIKFKQMLNPRIDILNPVSHDKLIKIVKKCKFVISDSGGLQEECSFLNKKIIVCRKNTERPESINIHSFLCVTPGKLEKLVDKIMLNYKIDKKCPYGNGYSWKKIRNILNDMPKNK
jgi:UDP-N-acetylglucosamine 2-epimerase (non-hydrolysing)